MGAGGPDEAASCAAHRRNAAVASCERCGIFMCALCRTECDGLTICAPCFERLAAEGTLHSAATRYRDYVGLSWLCGLVAGGGVAGGLVTGPAAVFYALRGARQMSEWGDVGGRGRAIAAISLGVATTILGGVTWPPCSADPWRPARRPAHAAGHLADFGTWQRVYETPEAVVVDEANGISGRRHRVFYDEVVLVTYHSSIGWSLAILMAASAFIGLVTLGALAVGELMGRPWPQAWCRWCCWR